MCGKVVGRIARIRRIGRIHRIPGPCRVWPAGSQGKIVRIRRIGRIARQTRGYQNGGAEDLAE
jgi:hypothetical protein